MMPYSKFLHNATQGRNNWLRYAFFFALVWWGSKLIGNIIQSIGESILGYDHILSFAFSTNVIRHILIIGFLGILMQTVHKRSFSSLLSSTHEFDMNKLGFATILGAGIVFGLGALSMWLVYDQPLLWSWQGEKELFRIIQELLFYPLIILGSLLFFKAYLLQAITLRVKKPYKAILWVTLILWFTGISDLLWYVIRGDVSGFQFRWFFNSYILVNILLLILIVLEEGIELALGYSIGQSFYSILVDEAAMQKVLFPGEDVFGEGLVFAFSYGWGRLLVIGIFLLIVARRYKLRNRNILYEPIPSPSDETYNLIDQIGQE